MLDQQSKSTYPILSIAPTIKKQISKKWVDKWQETHKKLQSRNFRQKKKQDQPLQPSNDSNHGNHSGKQQPQKVKKQKLQKPAKTSKNQANLPKKKTQKQTLNSELVWPAKLIFYLIFGKRRCMHDGPWPNESLLLGIPAPVTSPGSTQVRLPDFLSLLVPSCILGHRPLVEWLDPWCSGTKSSCAGPSDRDPYTPSVEERNVFPPCQDAKMPRCQCFLKASNTLKCSQKVSQKGITHQELWQTIRRQNRTCRKFSTIKPNSNVIRL